jgi:hypothetical protein
MEHSGTQDIIIPSKCSPYNSASKRPIGQKRVSYDTSIDQNTGVNKSLVMNYYSNDHAYK